MKIMKARLHQAFTLPVLAVVALGAGAALGQTYPAKPVRIILGQVPGGVQDVLTRAVAQELNKIWGQPVIVENRPGVGDVIATTAVAKSTPDGYTILFSTSTNMNTAQFLRRNLPYDPVKDFVPVVGVAQTKAFLFVSNKVPAGNVRELVALARAKPGVLNYGSWGIASAAHIDAEAFAKAAGVKFTHVPYNGVPPLNNALITGDVDFVFGSPTTVSLVRQGKLRAMAYTGRERSSALPEVPTLTEVGYEFESVGMFSLYAPAGTPRAIVNKIATDTSNVRAMPAFQNKFIVPNGMEELPLQGDALAARLQQSRETFADRIKGLDIRLD